MTLSNLDKSGSSSNRVKLPKISGRVYNSVEVSDFNVYNVKLKTLNLEFKNYNNSKFSNKKYGIIRAYGVNTYQGIVRSYNEDRVSIILNMSKNQGYIGKWPRCSMFAIYDGHAGHKCADYLRDNFFDLITKDINFPNNPKEALSNAFKNAEKYFTENIATDSNGNLIDISGSCIILALFVNDICYIANLGDSRAILSKNNTITQITTDHRPDNIIEYTRISKNGGTVYKAVKNNETGPSRVSPGKLSVISFNTGL